MAFQRSADSKFYLLCEDLFAHINTGNTCKQRTQVYASSLWTSLHPNQDVLSSLLLPIWSWVGKQWSKTYVKNKAMDTS